MGTKISLHLSRGVEDSKNADAVVVAVDGKLTLKSFKSSKSIATKDGNSLGSRLTSLRRDYSLSTGRIDFPDTYCVPLHPDKFEARMLLVSVVPDAQKYSESKDRVEVLYNTYMRIYGAALAKGCKTIALPVLGFGMKGYQKEEIYLSLLSSLSDFLKHSTELDEICFAGSTGAERRAALKWLGTLSLTFGLGYWYQRSDFDFQKDSSVVVYEPLHIM
jgi:O-acetyl-ADP-ribose deacetylase (regulator of RNase III)